MASAGVNGVNRVIVIVVDAVVQDDPHVDDTDGDEIGHNYGGTRYRHCGRPKQMLVPLVTMRSSVKLRR